MLNEFKEKARSYADNLISNFVRAELNKVESKKLVSSAGGMPTAVHIGGGKYGDPRKHEEVPEPTPEPA